MSSVETVKTAALDALRCGIVTLPPAQDGSKAPKAYFRQGLWGLIRDEPYSAKEIEKIYEEKRCTGVGVATGVCSGGLECLDFDDRSAWSEFVGMCERAGLRQLLDRVTHGYLEHTPNGIHLFWRCSEVSGSQKLARYRDSEGKIHVLCETKGEGGFVIVAPTYGSVNASGDYALRSGGFGSIAKVSPEERRSILTIARAMCRLTAENVEDRRIPEPRSELDEERPGDEYNREAKWSDILGPHGWKECGTFRGVTHWRRPGKSRGVSATTNYANAGLLYVFSTSTEFESERGYSKFSAYAILEHNGDFSSASRELRNMGFGQAWETEVLDVEADEAAFLRILNGKKSKKIPDILTQNPFGSPMPEHLLKVPGFLGEFCDFVNETSQKRQPVLALGAGISLMSNLIARRVKTGTNLRSNLYVLGVAETGAGKERPRQVIKELMGRLGESSRCAVEDVTSDTAVFNALLKQPASVALMDEFGKILKAIQQSELKGGPAASVVLALLKLYSSSGSYMSTKHFANREAKVLEQPSLSVYGTTVPGSLLKSIHPENLTDGLMNRILIFFSEQRDPEFQGLDSVPGVPDSLVEFARGWVDWPEAPNVGPLMRDGAPPDPKVVEMTADAKEALNGLHSHIRDIKRQEVLKGDSPVLSALHARAYETAVKLALIHACSKATPQTHWPSIGRSDAVWGVEMTKFLVGKSSEILVRHTAQNEEDDFCAALLRELEQTGRATLSDLGRRPEIRKRVRASKRAGVLREKVRTLNELGLVITTGKKPLTVQLKNFTAN